MERANFESQLRRALEERDLERQRPLIEALAQHFGFRGFCWLWGPILHRSHRVIYRPLIWTKFSWLRWDGGYHWKNEPWSDSLEKWLQEAVAASDTELVSRLNHWKFLHQAQFKSSRSEALYEQWVQERLRSWAHKPEQLGQQLRQIDFAGPAISESLALRIFEVDPKGCHQFILGHLPRTSKALWKNFFEAVRIQYPQLAWPVFRQTAQIRDWMAQLEVLCSKRLTVEELETQLLECTPNSVRGNDLAAGLLLLLQKKGKEAFGYVVPQLHRVWKPLFGRGNYGKILELCQKNDWLDLWGATIRVCAAPTEYNEQVRQVLALASSGLREPKLAALAGMGRQWNFSGFGLAQAQTLECKTALAMHTSAPGWLRGPFRENLQLWPHVNGYKPLLEKLSASAHDRELLDFLASRFLLALKPGEEVRYLFDYYDKLRSQPEYPRRAANVLTKVPSFAVWNYKEIVGKNPLARLLFEQSFEAFSRDPLALVDLVEASNIYVARLGYRCLALADPKVAATHKSLLLGCLFRPIQRATRRWAFAALERASQSDLDTATVICRRGRQALKIADEDYPKESLCLLLGQILTRWPSLRRPSEHPVVYSREARCV